jgi:predicted TPR repeat methyltransferase
VWVNFGVAERRAGRPEAAAAAYRRALAIDPELAAALDNLEVLERRSEDR